MLVKGSTAIAGPLGMARAVPELACAFSTPASDSETKSFGMLPPAAGKLAPFRAVTA
jgi:hypothetical protein